jgi:hypothetical protein
MRSSAMCRACSALPPPRAARRSRMST